jgi:hypothetical protein
MELCILYDASNNMIDRSCRGRPLLLAAVSEAYSHYRGGAVTGAVSLQRQSSRNNGDSRRGTGSTRILTSATTAPLDSMP